MLKKILLIVMSGFSAWASAATCPSYTDWGRTQIGADKQWGLKASDKITSENWQVTQPYFNYPLNTLPSTLLVTVFLSEGGNQVRCLYSLDQGGALIAVTSKFIDFDNATQVFTNSIYESDVGMGPVAHFYNTNNPSLSYNDGSYQFSDDKGRVLEKVCHTTASTIEACSFDWK